MTNQRANPSLFADVRLPPGSLVIERYEYVRQSGRPGHQWLAQAVNHKGELELVEACMTRRKALAALTDEYAAPEREHTDV